MEKAGTTTNQMKTAPQDAVYIWPTLDLGYPVRLATHLGRRDLKIVSPFWLTWKKWEGHKFSAIVVDHAALLDLQQINSLALARRR